MHVNYIWNIIMQEIKEKKKKSKRKEEKDSSSTSLFLQLFFV